jgi:aminopeptidase N
MPDEADDPPVETFRKDYTPTDYEVQDINLTFRIADGSTTVLSKVKMGRREGTPASAR